VIIDMRARPPSPQFNSFFQRDFLEGLATRVGAKRLSQAFCDESVHDFVDEMDAANVDVAIALGRNSPAMKSGKIVAPAGVIPNQHIVDLQLEFPGRIIGFAGIDVAGEIHNPMAETQSFVVDGDLHGIFIEPQRAFGGNPDDARIFLLYELCEAESVPVNIMTGPVSGSHVGFADPAPIDRVPGQFPDLKIICGHGCWPRVDEMIAVAFKHTNVYVSPDCYLFMPGAASRYVEAANGFMADQFLFGSAYPVLPLDQAVEDFKKLPFSSTSLEKALGLNAKSLLNL
tara:strand:+ start:3009 stop:3866 length:858 start_codon:yes stop_codon:yes gene_type:complete